MGCSHFMNRLVPSIPINRKKVILLTAAIVAMASLVMWVRPQGLLPPRFHSDAALDASLRSVTEDFRQIIVLMDGAENLDEATRARCLNAGRQIFYRKQRAIEDLKEKLAGRRNQNAIRQLIQYLTGGGGLHDADKLAFLDVAEELDKPGDRSPLGGSIKALLDNLQAIQLTYREEVTRIFSQFGTRGAAPAREKWDAYVRALRRTSQPRQDPRRIRRAVTPEPSLGHARRRVPRDLRQRFRAQNRGAHLRRRAASQVHRPGSGAAAQIRICAPASSNWA